MRKYLDIPKIDYVLTHLKFRCDFPVELSRRLVFLKQEELGAIPQNCVVFPLSNQKRSVNHKIGQLPIFYPVLKKESSHIVKSNDSLLFSHDILQEIFCLQTLYYEQEVNDKDKLGRIRPESTLNYKLDILNKPLVDYLFEVIVGVLEDFCQTNGIPFKRVNLLSKHTFLLSHDVDRIETYSFYNTLNSFKKLILSPNNTNLVSASKHIKEYLKGKNRANPLWDFPKMRKVEQEYQLKSTYYFLNQGKLHQDAYYSFSSPKILKLIKEIESDQQEIGLHLTIAGNRDKLIVQRNLSKLNRVIQNKVIGVRSHWLRFETTITPDILEQLGLKYDTSIGHYSQEGFRAGTCLPYKLFSFEQNRILDVWEIPLIYMDCMILDYQNISQAEALNRLKRLLLEVVKFNGIFSLLWHNGNFANNLPYNRYNFYQKLINLILTTNPINTTAKSLLESLEENNK